MRPLKLRISGLRSYRSEVTIDFGDPGLIAIVGDTGAGKSSILEALFFVLYGGCTWDHRATTPLISDGATVMQVELEFLAEGRRWRIFRSASRTASQGRHELECLDDPAIRFDNDVPVTDEVRRLVGLDPKAFLRTVILPQGQFQMLLQATPGQRTAILKGIFRLEQLAQARGQADLAARRLRPDVETLKLARAALLPDPEAALADARERHQQAQARQTRLQNLSVDITAAARKRDEADRQLNALREKERHVRDSMVPDADTELARLSSTASQFDDRRRQLETERAQYRMDADSLGEVLRRADNQGEGIEALASAASTLQSLAGQLPGVHEEEAWCEQEARALEQLSANITTSQTEATSLEARASAARTEETRLVGIANTAGDLLGQARTRLATARSYASNYSARQQAVLEATTRESVAATAIDPAAARARGAEADRKAASSALEDVRRAHAAAHAADGCQPGDPCPVCQRPLPADFAILSPPGESEARAKLQDAERAATQATRVQANAEADLRNASGDLQRASQAAQDAETTLKGALSELRQVISGAHLTAEDATLLAPLVGASNAATAALEQQASTADDLTGQAGRAAAEIEALRRDVSRRSDQLGQRQKAVRERIASSEKDARELPDGYRVNVPLTADMLADVSERVRRRRAELNQVSERLAEARQRIDQVANDLETLNEQLRAEVEGPARQLVVRLSAAEQRVNDLAALLGIQSVSARSSGGLANDAKWAGELKTATDALLAQTQETASTLQQKHSEAISTISSALTTAGVDDEPGLQQAVVDASADLSRAADEIQAATEQIPRAAELDEKIQQGQGLIEALDELSRLLADGKFIGYVVARKQQTLLAIATELLGSMTGNRYGFSEIFEIIDRLTGLPRGVKTLSGGETFLASLALALGLVELAGRGGGRLESLFLDEGFGSLDANALSEALDALGRQAETGRMVAVISHLRSVAEAMDRVLAVTSGPSGSEARWLGGDERDDLVTEDIEASLLT
jgi:DNA repair exonuclease SbcCD ATPase subunit